MCGHPLFMHEWAESHPRRPTGFDDASRASHPLVGDAFTGALAEAVAAQLANTDESALGSLTPAEVMADPFGTLGALIDLPSYMQQALPGTAELASLSSREMLYLATYLRQALSAPRTPLPLRAISIASHRFTFPVAASRRAR